MCLENKNVLSNFILCKTIIYNVFYFIKDCYFNSTRNSKPDLKFLKNNNVNSFKILRKTLHNSLI